MMSQREVAALAAMGVLFAGCARQVEPMPATHPVTGTVHYKQGGPVPGSVTFQAMTDQQLAFSGPIEDDGTFTVSTLRTSDQQRVDGMPEGDYRVAVFPQANDKYVVPQELPGKVTVKAGENRFEFKIDRVSAKSAR
jgi:hypothetical protein